MNSTRVAAPLRLQHLDQPHFGRARHVRPAAGRQVKALDVHQPQLTVAPRWQLAQRQAGRRLARHLAGPHGPVLPHDLVGQLLGRAYLFNGQFDTIQVDGHALPAQVEANRLRLGHTNEGLRQDVLAGVLLHVVEAARPVDFARRHARRDGHVEHVQHRFVALAHDNVYHPRHLLALFQDAGVVGLPPRRGVEIGQRQPHRRTPRDLRRLHHLGRKRHRVTIPIISPLAHSSPSP